MSLYLSTGTRTIFDCDTEERYSDIKKFHTDEGYFTADKVRDIRDGNFNAKDRYHYLDLQKSLGFKWTDMTDQEIADVLNKVAVRQPKAKRGEPTQAIAESKKRRKIRIRVKRK